MKKNIAVVCGGYSEESIISMKSATNVLKNIDNNLYNAYKIVITKSKWYVDNNNTQQEIDKNDFSFIIENKKINFDCALVMIHGTPGEDGKLQGYFDMINLPYTTSSLQVLALTFNKNICNNVAQQAGAIIPKSILINKNDKADLIKIINYLGIPMIVKPNSSGSSIGNSLVKTEDALKIAIEKAFEVDDEVLLQEFIKGTEITCGILKKNNKLLTFPLTEIATKNEFFDYEAKYNDGFTEEITPARVSESVEKDCKEISSILFKEFNCKGVSRFDYIVKNEKLYFLEVNTVPGMSEASIIPKQAQSIGMSLKDLYNTLIEEALKN